MFSASLIKPQKKYITEYRNTIISVAEFMSYYLKYKGYDTEFQNIKITLNYM